MFCPMCGEPNEDDALYCPNCGGALGPEDGSAGDMEEPAGRVSESLEAAGETDDPVQPPGSPGPDAEPDTSEAREVVLAEDRVAGRAASRTRTQPARQAFRPASTPAVPTSGLAIASFVLGIGGLTVLPLLGSIAAVLLGYLARSDIRQRPGEVTGDGLAVAGLVMGWAAIGIAVLISILALLGITAGLCCLGPCGILSFVASQ